MGLPAEAILHSGGQLLFESRMRVVHDFAGWPMEGDIRRNIGYGTITTRLRDRALPYAWLARLGLLRSRCSPWPRLWIVDRIVSDAAEQYRVRWYELPVAFCLAVVVHVMEIPGMISAFRGQEITETAYL
jgi:hypothetical protein